MEELSIAVLLYLDVVIDIIPLQLSLDECEAARLDILFDTGRVWRREFQIDLSSFEVVCARLGDVSFWPTP